MEQLTINNRRAEVHAELEYPIKICITNAPEGPKYITRALKQFATESCALKNNLRTTYSRKYGNLYLSLSRAMSSLVFVCMTEVKDLKAMSLVVIILCSSASVMVC